MGVSWAKASQSSAASQSNFATKDKQLMKPRWRTEKEAFDQLTHVQWHGRAGRVQPR